VNPLPPHAPAHQHVHRHVDEMRIDSRHLKVWLKITCVVPSF